MYFLTLELVNVPLFFTGSKLIKVVQEENTRESTGGVGLNIETHNAEHVGCPKVGGVALMISSLVQSESRPFFHLVLLAGAIGRGLPSGW